VAATILTQTIESGQSLLSDTKPLPLAMSYFRKKFLAKIIPLPHSCFIPVPTHLVFRVSSLVRSFYSKTEDNFYARKRKGGETVH